MGTRLAGANRIRNAEHKHKDTRSEFIADQEHPSRFIQATSAVFQPEFLPSQVGFENFVVDGEPKYRSASRPAGATAVMAVLAPTQCKLLTGPAAASAQLLLAIAAFSGLVYKRSACASMMQRDCFDCNTEFRRLHIGHLNIRNDRTRYGAWMSASKWCHQRLLMSVVWE